LFNNLILCLSICLLIIYLTIWFLFLSFYLLIIYLPIWFCFINLSNKQVGKKRAFFATWQSWEKEEIFCRHRYLITTFRQKHKRGKLSYFFPCGKTSMLALQATKCNLGRRNMWLINIPFPVVHLENNRS
jgi:hypothetical protein